MKPEELIQKIDQRLEQWQKAQENQTSGYDCVGGPIREKLHRIMAKVR